MNISDLNPADLRERLRGRGLRFRSGPFVYSLKTKFRALADHMALLYPDYELLDDCQFADFHVVLAPGPGLLGRVLSQATFSLEGSFQLNPFPARMANAYLEWGLNCCIYRRIYHLLVVHAATLERGGRAMLIAGPSGAGKSTLAAAMALSGWRLLSDELALVSPETGEVFPLARPFSLKNQSIDLIKQRAEGVIVGQDCISPRKGRVAHVRPPAEAVARMHETARPAWVLMVDYQQEAELSLREVSRARAMMHVAHHTFSYRMMGETGFVTLADMIDQCECYRLTYSRLDDALARLDGPEFQPAQLAHAESSASES